MIPSSGFYEWTHDGKKQKYLFKLPDTGSLYMAGLYNEFDGESRFVILTTEANASMSDVHNRMPVVLDQDRMDKWLLDPQTAIDVLSLSPPILIKTAI